VQQETREVCKYVFGYDESDIHILEMLQCAVVRVLALMRLDSQQSSPDSALVGPESLGETCLKIGHTELFVSVMFVRRGTA